MIKLANFVRTLREFYSDIKTVVAAQLSDILLKSDMKATRFSLASGAILWGILLFYPGDLFTPTRQTYAIMAEIAPELVWGTAFFIQGWFAFYTLLFGVRNHVTLAMDAFLGCVLWTASTVACYLSHFHGWSSYQPPAAMSGEAILTVASWWHLIRYWAQEAHEHKFFLNTNFEQLIKKQVGNHD